MKQNILRLTQYNKISPFFDELLQNDDLSVEHMSSVWKKVLGRRRNFPTFNEMAVFRRGMATGVGYRLNFDESAEYVEFLRNLGRARSMTPLEYIKDNQESDVGLPYQFSRDGVLSSSAGLLNTAHAYRIEKALSDFHVSPTKHRILEIGAGYGGVAEILIKNLQPDTYVICDLPHNLYLSAYYLSMNYPDRVLHFINKSAPKDILEHSLVFTTPGGLELLKERFTLAINTFSFQEMALSEIHRYFRYVRSNLADEGLFYFLNRHGDAGAQKPGDYPFGMFALKAWRPLPCPTREFLQRKQHYEAILQQKRDTKSELPPYFDSVTHTLSLLMFMGVDTNIVPFCARLVDGEIRGEEQEYLASLHGIITSQSTSFALEQLSALKTPNDWLPVTLYVSGLLKLFSQDFSGAENDLNQAILNDLSGFARTKALVCLGLLSHSEKSESEAQSLIEQAIENSPHFLVDLEQALDNITIGSFKGSYKFAFPNLKNAVPKDSSMLRRLARRAGRAFSRILC